MQVYYTCQTLDKTLSYFKNTASCHFNLLSFSEYLFQATIYYAAKEKKKIDNLKPEVICHPLYDND